MSTSQIQIALREVFDRLYHRRPGPNGLLSMPIFPEISYNYKSARTLDISLFSGCSIVADRVINLDGTSKQDVTDAITSILVRHNDLPVEKFQDFLLGESDDKQIFDNGQLSSITDYAWSLRVAHDAGCTDYARYVGVNFALGLESIHGIAAHGANIGRINRNMRKFFECVDIIFRCGHGSGNACTILADARMLLVNWWWSNVNLATSINHVYSIDVNIVRSNAMFAAAVVESALMRTLTWDRPALHMLQGWLSESGLELNLLHPGWGSIIQTRVRP